MFLFTYKLYRLYGYLFLKENSNQHKCLYLNLIDIVCMVNHLKKN